MVKGVGIDIEPIHRISRLLGRYDSPTLQLIFTGDELERGRRAECPAQHLAVCFSAKEAMGKALGTGLANIDWNAIEADVQSNQVVLTLYRAALRLAADLGASCWQAKWSCWHDHVMVVVMVQ